MNYYFDSSVIISSILNPYQVTQLKSNSRNRLFTSRLSQVEVLRVITKLDQTLNPRAVDLLRELEYIELVDEIIDLASLYPAEITLKSSDAIHMATAEQILDVDDLLVTYDKQMARNAQALGYKVLSAL